MKKKYIVFLALGMASYAYSMPAKYKKCENKITEPRDSNGYYWAKDCSAIYVMPPAKNKMIVDSIAFATADQECSALKTVMDSYAGKISKLQKSYKPSQLNAREIRKLEKKIISQNKQLANQVTKRIKLLNQKDDVEIVAIPLRKQIEAYEEKMSSLDESSYEYLKIQRKKKTLDKSMMKVESAIEIIDLELSTISSKEEAINKSVEQLRKLIDGYQPPVDTSIDDMAKLMDQMNAQLEPYKTGYGGTVKVVMENKHTDLVKAFKKKNRKVTVYRMPTTSAVQFKVQGMANLLNDSVRSINIPGVSSTNGEAIEGYTNINFGESLAGSVDVSTLSACMLKIGQDKRDDSIAKFAVNILHKYDLSVKNDYNITYNMSEIYKKVKSQTSKGGFFKTKSVRKLTESLRVENSLDVEFNAEDPRDNYDLEAQKEIMDKFIIRAVEKKSVTTIPANASHAMNLPESRGNAASVASKGLRKCPHLYCQIAGYALDLGNALFGSAEQSNEYLRTINERKTERVENNKAYSHYTTSTFYKED